jgi:hypothetical protein
VLMNAVAPRSGLAGALEISVSGTSLQGRETAADRSVGLISNPGS